MKVASKKPNTVQQVVYVTNDIYEVWFAQPVSLGKIYKRGDYWYSIDGHRHVSSRDAMRYLISHTEVNTSLDITEGTIPDKVEKQSRSPRQVASLPAETQMNQNHPQFQQFLDFLDYQTRRGRMAQLSRAGGSVDTDK